MMMTVIMTIVEGAVVIQKWGLAIVHMKVHFHARLYIQEMLFRGWRSRLYRIYKFLFVWHCTVRNVLYDVIPAQIYRFLLLPKYLNCNIWSSHALWFTYLTTRLCSAVRDFSPPPRCSSDLRSSGISRRDGWHVLTDVSGPICRVQGAQEERVTLHPQCGWFP
jgi:hypothetical protein